MSRRPTKICVILPAHWAAIMGGAQYQAKCLVDELLQTGRFDIHYLARRINQDYRPERYRITKIADHTGLRRYGYFFDALRLLRLLSELQPDVIYQRVACAYTGIAAYYAKRAGCRMVWHVAHDMDVMPPRYDWSLKTFSRFLERSAIAYGLRSADCIVTQTEQQAELLRRHYGREPTAIIPNFHPMPTEQIEKGGIVRVLWIANLKLMKRPELFVRLARDLKHLENARFLMVGSLDTIHYGYDELMAEIAELTNLEYLGGKTQEEVNALLATADIFVNTSRYEGFPNTFIQAWMRRMPVVSMDVDPDGVLVRERIGFCPRDYNRMLENLRGLIVDANHRRAMGQRAQEYAFRWHSTKNADRLIEILSE